MLAGVRDWAPGRSPPAPKGRSADTCCGADWRATTIRLERAPRPGRLRRAGTPQGPKGARTRAALRPPTGTAVPAYASAVDLEALNDRTAKLAARLRAALGIKGAVTFQAGGGGDVEATLTHAHAGARARVRFGRGGVRVASFMTPGGDEVLGGEGHDRGVSPILPGYDPSPLARHANPLGCAEWRVAGASAAPPSDPGAERAGEQFDPAAAHEAAIAAYDPRPTLMLVAEMGPWRARLTVSLARPDPPPPADAEVEAAHRAAPRHRRAAARRAAMALGSLPTLVLPLTREEAARRSDARGVLAAFWRARAAADPLCGLDDPALDPAAYARAVAASREARAEAVNRRRAAGQTAADETPAERREERHRTAIAVAKLKRLWMERPGTCERGITGAEGAPAPAGPAATAGSAAALEPQAGEEAAPSWDGAGDSLETASRLSRARQAHGEGGSIAPPGPDAPLPPRVSLPTRVREALVTLAELEDVPRPDLGPRDSPLQLRVALELTNAGKGPLDFQAGLKAWLATVDLDRAVSRERVGVFGLLGRRTLEEPEGGTTPELSVEQQPEVRLSELRPGLLRTYVDFGGQSVAIVATGQARCVQLDCPRGWRDLALETPASGARTHIGLHPTAAIVPEPLGPGETWVAETVVTHHPHAYPLPSRDRREQVFDRTREEMRENELYAQHNLGEMFTWDPWQQARK